MQVERVVASYATDAAGIGSKTPALRGGDLRQVLPNLLPGVLTRIRYQNRLSDHKHPLTQAHVDASTTEASAHACVLRVLVRMLDTLHAYTGILGTYKRVYIYRSGNGNNERERANAYTRVFSNRGLSLLLHTPPPRSQARPRERNQFKFRGRCLCQIAATLC